MFFVAELNEVETEKEMEKKAENESVKKPKKLGSFLDNTVARINKERKRKRVTKNKTTQTKRKTQKTTPTETKYQQLVTEAKEIKDQDLPNWVANKYPFLAPAMIYSERRESLKFLAWLVVSQQ